MPTAEGTKNQFRPGLKVIKIDSLTYSHTGLSQTNIQGIANSIQQNGLLQPPVVDEKFNVIFGRHRIEAYRLLGRTKIKVRVSTTKSLAQKKIMSISENLHRNEYSPFEKSKQYVDLDNLLSKSGQVSTHGGARGKTREPHLEPSAKVIAKSTKESQRSVQEFIQIGKNLHPSVKEKIQSGKLAERLTKENLLQIVRNKMPKDQLKQLSAIINPGSKTKKPKAKKPGEKIKTSWLKPLQALNLRLRKITEDYESLLSFKTPTQRNRPKAIEDLSVATGHIEACRKKVMSLKKRMGGKNAIR